MFQRLSFLFVCISLAVCVARAQDVTGDWLGTLKMPARELRLALHISKVGDGLKATLDSVDQGVSGVPIDSIQLEDAKLTFNLKVLQVSYEGRVDTAGSLIEGTFSQGPGSLPLTLRRGVVTKTEHKPAPPSDIDGDWTGTIATQAYVFHIMNTEDGLIVSVDVPDQHIKDLEASSVKRDGSSLNLEWRVFGSQLSGKIAEDLSSIEGTATQAGSSIPFKLVRKSAGN